MFYSRTDCMCSLNGPLDAPRLQTLPELHTFTFDVDD
ncbi:hypothetical protein WG66_007458 [Moniliophthora roreri]|nr:hypothetical protein WG66_007458 [Moniliophthora roreri]